MCYYAERERERERRGERQRERERERSERERERARGVNKIGRPRKYDDKMKHDKTRTRYIHRLNK